MSFGFSFIGLIFLVMLFVPNIIWTRNKPLDYDKYVLQENKVLLTLERIGEATVSFLMLINDDMKLLKDDPSYIWLILTFVVMILYEIFWISYFHSEKKMQDFYSSILGIPVAGASLPVIGVLLMAVFRKSIVLFIAGIILGIGHIGIHLEHRSQINKK